MKILLVSDSHRDVKYLYEVVEKENPNIIMYAGDHSSDAYDLNLAFDIPVYIVRGNCDYDDYTGIDIEKIKIDGLGKVILTHGHLFDVKRNMNSIYTMGVEKNANMVIFGHTHIQHLSKFNNILFVNPGAIVNHEYAIYQDGNIEFKGGRNV